MMSLAAKSAYKGGLPSGGVGQTQGTRKVTSVFANAVTNLGNARYFFHAVFRTNYVEY